MLFKVFWGSLGLVFGLFGSLLEALLVLLRALGGTLNFQTFYLGSLEPPSWPPRSLQQPQAAPQAPSWRGRGPHEATEAHLDMHFDPLSSDVEAEFDANHSSNPIISHTCYLLMAARRLPRSVRRSAAPPAHGVLNPGSTSLTEASAKLNGRAAALAGPLTFLRFPLNFLLMRSVARR